MIHLDMGKYAAFVWTAYGISLVVLLGLVADSLRRAGHWRREAERLQEDREREQP